MMATQPWCTAVNYGQAVPHGAANSSLREGDAMESYSGSASATTSEDSDRRLLRSRLSQPRTIPMQSSTASQAGMLRGLPARPMARGLEDARWEGTLVGLHEDGSNFTARVTMTQRRSKTGMPIGFLASSSDAVEGVRLEVKLHRTRAYTHPPVESVPDAMVIVNAPDETQLANDEAAILLDDNREGACRSPVEMLIADRYLDRHPGLRIGFFSESLADPTAEGPKRSAQHQNSTANSYVHKQVEFQRCCDVVRTMRLLWQRSDEPPPSHV